MNVILGVDPGSQFTGYGVVEDQEDQVLHIDHGVLAIPRQLNFADKLNYLAQELTQLFERYQPTDVVVEKVFLGKNVDSAFKLGHVRGICLQQAALARAQTYEYAARSVKKAVTGHGGASKDQVHLLVTNLLKIKTDAKFDATDALALAICHARSVTTSRILEMNLKRGIK